METKFTKGEWMSKELVVYNSETGQTIAHIGKWAVKTEEESEANAKLIAAAPEMFEMLQNIKIALKSLHCDIIINDIDNLLRKATE